MKPRYLIQTEDDNFHLVGLTHGTDYTPPYEEPVFVDKNGLVVCSFSRAVFVYPCWKIVEVVLDHIDPD